MIFERAVQWGNFFLAWRSRRFLRTSSRRALAAADSSGVTSINLISPAFNWPLTRIINFQTVTVNEFSSLAIHLVTVIQSVRPATCLDHFNGMVIGLIKVSALTGDNFQNLIICEGTFIDRYRLIGGIISL